MTRVEEYQRKAQDCERLAESIKDQDSRNMLLETAEQWRRMAAQAERHEW